MLEDEDDVEECGESFASKSGLCPNRGIYSDGKCGFHTDDDESDYEPRTNVKHGLHSSEYYKELPEREQNYIDIISDDLLDKSRYTQEDHAMVKKCRQIAIDIHQKDRADGYIATKGMTQENIVGVHEEYGEMTETQENTLFVTKDRLSREARLSMKDLGILDEDSNKTEEAAETLIESLSNDMNS